jgi:1,4-alpha-glucan branching enzyme
MKKTPSASGKTTVTFELPAEARADSATLCGDFNSWAPDSHVMKRRKDGSFATTVRLQPGRYHYRYLLNGDTWENDWAADEYVPNRYGSDDSVLVLP